MTSTHHLVCKVLEILVACFSGLFLRAPNLALLTICNFHAYIMQETLTDMLEPWLIPLCSIPI